KRLLTALPVAFLLTSCSSSKPPASGLPKLLPAALAQPCPTPVAAADDSADAALLTLKQLYDQYGLCAGLHWDTVQHLQKD
ncbi:hypothetical protein QO207_31410, partial [Pseudomonas sp. CAN2814]|uniref:hypothetical protein n=1 Tax=Pseudomonas sp. CAN1 TaxID=3046726 RepID=UPI002647F1BE